MYSIVRVFWGSDKARKLRETLQPSTDPAKRLDAFLKNKSICVHALTVGGELVAYFATSHTPGDETLACHFIQPIKRNAVRPMAIQLLLDHTGCKSIMMFGGSERQVAYLESLGFILVENNWSAPTALYKDVVLDKRVQDVTGLPRELISEKDQHELDVILSCSILAEGEYDPLERYVLGLVKPGDVIERGRTGKYRTVVWREDDCIKGMAQLEYTTWGGASLTGIGVHPDYEKQRIARNLIAAVMKIASQTHEEISATTFAGNPGIEHLLGNVLRYTKLPGTYGTVQSEGTVSWKRTKNGVKIADRDRGPILVD